MTTIVANRQQMASDTLINDYGTRSHGQKIFRVKKDLVGVAGDHKYAEQFLHWYENRRRKKPIFPENADFEALVLTSKGELIVWDQDMTPLTVTDPFWAIGSGRDAALAVLHMGGTLTQAIEIAAKIDVQTELPYEIYDL